MSKKRGLDEEVSEQDSKDVSVDYRLSLLESTDMGRRFKGLRSRVNSDELNIGLIINEIEHMAKENARVRHEFMEEIETNRQEIDDLKTWKKNCTIWAAGWAGICAAFMTAATAIRVYWNEIKHFFQGLGQ